MTVEIIPLAGSYRFVEEVIPPSGACYHFPESWYIPIAEYYETGDWLATDDINPALAYYNGKGLYGRDDVDSTIKHKRVRIDDVPIEAIELYVVVAYMDPGQQFDPRDPAAQITFRPGEPEEAVYETTNPLDCVKLIAEGTSNTSYQRGVYVYRIPALNGEHSVDAGIRELQLFFTESPDGANIRLYTIKDIVLGRPSFFDIAGSCPAIYPYDFLTAWSPEWDRPDDEVYDVSLEWDALLTQGQYGWYNAANPGSAGAGPYGDYSKKIVAQGFDIRNDDGPLLAPWMRDYLPTSITITLYMYGTATLPTNSFIQFIFCSGNPNRYVWQNLGVSFPELATEGEHTIVLTLSEADITSLETMQADRVDLRLFLGLVGSFRRAYAIKDIQFDPAPARSISGYW